MSLVLDNVYHLFAHSKHKTPDPVSVRLSAGERLLILGRNGSGKTTLLRCLAGLIRHEGTIEIGNLTLRAANAPQIRSKIGYLFQKADESFLLPLVLEDICLGPINDGHSQQEAVLRARHWLSRLGLQGMEYTKIHTLSAGQRQLVALAGLLVREPQWLLLDEPTAPLDSQHTDELLDILDDHPSTQVIVTHNPQLFLDRQRRPSLTLTITRSPT